MDLQRDLSDIDLLSLHVTTLFRHDAKGRLSTINEPGFPDPPRFWMGRTIAGNRWRFHHALPAETVAALEELCRSEPITADLRQPHKHAAAIKAVLQRHAPIRNEYRGPAYVIAKEIRTPSQVTLITATNADCLRPHFVELLEPDVYHQLGPVAAVVREGSAVAVAFCSRIPGVATEAGANTHKDYRQRGYGASAVAGWAAAVCEQQCLPLYSTGWDNLASQGLANKLGMYCYGEDWSLQ